MKKEIENNINFKEYAANIEPIIEEGYYQLCICDRYIPSLIEAKDLNYGKNIFGLKSSNFDEFYIRPIYGEFKNGEMEELTTGIKLKCISEVHIIENTDKNDKLQYNYSNPCYTYAKKVDLEEILKFLKILGINIDESKKCYISPLVNYLKDVTEKYKEIVPKTPEEKMKEEIQAAIKRLRQTKIY